MVDRAFPLSRRSLLGGAVAFGLGGLAALKTATAAPPRRVAVLDWGLAACCVALGCVPVGVPAPSWGTRYAGAPALPAGVVDVGLLFTPNFELLQALEPDAILITPGLEAMRGPLERVAPVVTVTLDRPGAGVLERAGSETRRLAALLGLEAAAETLAARAEAALEEAAATLAPLADRPVWLVNILDQRHVNVFGSSSLHHAVLGRLGLRNAWNGESSMGEFVPVGLERLAGVPDARLVNVALGGFGRLTAMAANPFWQAMSFARDGRTYEIGSVLGSAGLPAVERLARLLTAALSPVEAVRG
ncbi:ABC transporter substrate-binding protein [Azospirillum melinis]|uniref:ABC transporter substrate-binding protein n=1 Tax=Azospirillum melinis TaxID=328839 RepID=A0ABX2KH95_9PROT|nr:ABC transporter substrate-binding protein [Azospirillum melinis]MBP2310213.1 iron complex transport system substrate-binding protein [Azospirillum melinis]NUB02083.1 ABC transporter substrate-binding protein [Azospirillum melinis]